MVQGGSSFKNALLCPFMVFWEVRDVKLRESLKEFLGLTADLIFLPTMCALYERTIAVFLTDLYEHQHHDRAQE